MWPLLTLSRCKYCPTQLSANKFVPWMLTAFIHSLPPAVFFGCYTATRTNTPPWPLEGIYWTYWHWLIVWTLILTPQFVVLAAFIRVHRFDPNLNSVQVYQPMDLNDASASGWTMKEERMSLRASFWPGGGRALRLVLSKTLELQRQLLHNLMFPRARNTCAFLLTFQKVHISQKMI